MKLFLDTNIWVRLLLKDDERLYQQTNSLLGSVEEGKLKPYTSTVVLLEVYFVLTSVYKLKKELAVEDLRKILLTRNLVLVEKTDLKEALKLQSQTGLKLTDCIIVSQIPSGVILCSFDEELVKRSKKQGGEGCTPGELI